jgi:hypothetical protein
MSPGISSEESRMVKKDETNSSEKYQKEIKIPSTACLIESWVPRKSTVWETVKRSSNTLGSTHGRFYSSPC